MCFKKDKWQKDFKPTKKFLDEIKDITSVKKLHEFLRLYTWVKELKDYWKNPEEFLLESGDCEDFSIFAAYVLVTVIKILKARVLFFSGYNKEKNGKKVRGHSVVVFPYPYMSKLAIFSNDHFHSGFKSYLEIARQHYPDGLKRLQVRDYLGNIESNRHQLFGTF